MQPLQQKLSELANRLESIEQTLKCLHIATSASCCQEITIDEVSYVVTGLQQQTSDVKDGLFDEIEKLF